MTNNDSQRKLAYDAHNRCFYFESKIEALERVCSERAKKADAMNRNEDLQLGSYRKLIEQEEHMSSQKRDRQMNEVRESLREHVAYRRVLDKIKDKNDKNIKHPEKYGQYGQGCSHPELIPVIEDEFKLMSPQEKRRKEVRRLLRQRKATEVMDRTLPDDVILGKRHHKRQNVKRATSEERKRPKLVLPPLTVSMATARNRGAGSTGSDSAGKRSEVDVADNGVTLPSIFVTQAEMASKR